MGLSSTGMGCKSSGRLLHPMSGWASSCLLIDRHVPLCADRGDNSDLDIPRNAGPTALPDARSWLHLQTTS